RVPMPGSRSMCLEKYGVSSRAGARLQELAGRRRGVEALLMQVQLDPELLQLGRRQGPAVIAPVDRPTGGSARSCTRGELKTQIPANRSLVAFQLLCRTREAHLSLA